MAPEAPLEQTDAGLVVAGDGWFVVNARSARWVCRKGRGSLAPLTGWFESDDEAEWRRLVGSFPQLGVNLFVLEPGEPMSIYHAEEAQEDFLVLRGECLLIVESQERPLRQWDFVHCPPWTEHTIVGAGEEPCVVLAAGSRGGDGIRFPLNEIAVQHGAGSDVDTENGSVAYARFREGEPTPHRDGWLRAD